MVYLISSAAAIVERASPVSSTDAVEVCHGIYTSTSRAMLQSNWSVLLTTFLRDTAAAAAATATGVSRTHSSGMRLAGTVVLQGETGLSERKLLTVVV